MTLLELYDDYITKFSAEHKVEILASLKNYRHLRTESEKDKEENAYDYYPPHHIRNNNNNPAFFPIFKKFIDGFYQKFINKYKNEIKSDLYGHFSKMDDKSISELNKLKINYRPCRLSEETIKNKISMKLVIELIDQAVFDGQKHRKRSIFISEFEPNYIEIVDLTQCDYCNDFITIIYDFENKVFRPSDYFVESGRKCPILSKSKKEIFTYDFKLSIPSKKLIFLNDIRHVFEANRDDYLEVSINSALGKKRECEEYVKNGMAYFAMGNDSPHIYQSKTKNEIIIDPENAKLKWNEDTDNIKKIDEYDDRGFICTDLWAVCMADYDDFMKRCADKKIDAAKFRTIVVDIPTDKIKVKYNMNNYLIQISYQV